MINKAINFIRLLKEADNPIRLFISQMLWRTGLCKLVQITIPTNGYYIYFQPTALSATLWYDPDCRPFYNSFVSKYLRTGDTVVDIGSNIGTTALTAWKYVGSEGEIYAFEPHPRTFRYFINNIKLNKADNIKPFNTAIGEKTGYVHFTSKKSDVGNRISTYSGDIRIPVSTLDTFVEGAKKIALMKIDVEGYEKFVLEGSRKVLKQTECLYIEVSENHFKKFGYTMKDFFTVLENEGFSLFRIHDQKRLLIPTDRDYIQSVSKENIFALKNRDFFLSRSDFGIADDA